MTKAKKGDTGFKLYITETKMVKTDVTIEQRWASLPDITRELYNEEAKSKK